MKLKGIVDFSLGNFLCVRGFAPIGVLQKISQPDANYQRIPKDPRLREISDYLKKGEFLFFPEIILCTALNEGEEDSLQVSEFWEAVRRGQSKRTIRFAKGIRLSSTVTKSRKSDDIRAVQFYQTATIQFSSEQPIFSRIDGNHRLSATTEVTVRERVAPFCVILCRNPTEFRQFSRALFHNINYKQVPLPKEHNLRLILEDKDLFPDEKLKNDPSFGWAYYLGRQLQTRIDADLLPNLRSLLEEEPYSFFVDNLTYLLQERVLNENENAIPRFKQALSEVNAIFEANPILRDTKNRGLLAALTYYQLKAPRSITSFVRWIAQNHIYRIADSNPPDLISIFNQILETRKRTIFVSMPFGSPKCEDHYAIIERVAKEISETHALQPSLKVQRVDWFSDGTSYVITDKIIEMISDCGLLIGNLTTCNPNVYHEIGFVMGQAKAEGKDLTNMLLFLDESVSEKEKFVGFNLRGIKQLRFIKLETEFTKALRENLEKFFQLS